MTVIKDTFSFVQIKYPHMQPNLTLHFSVNTVINNNWDWDEDKKNNGWIKQ